MGRFGNKRAAREREQEKGHAEVPTPTPEVHVPVVMTPSLPSTAVEPSRPVVGATAVVGEPATAADADDFAAMRNAMTRALQKPKREQVQTVLLRMPADLLKAIDKAKGEASRNQFFVELARFYVKSIDK